MSTESNNEKELLRLCGLMVDGELDDLDGKRLSELLASDAAAREFYRGYVDAHAGLLLHFEPVPVFDEAAEEPVSERKTPSSPSSWWSFAASAALLLLVGLNAIQSAGNLEAEQMSKRPVTARMTDAKSRQLADAIGLTPSEVKRMAR